MDQGNHATFKPTKTSRDKLFVSALCNVMYEHAIIHVQLHIHLGWVRKWSERDEPAFYLTPADVKHLCISASGTDNEWMGGPCLSSAPLSPLWSSGKHLLIRDMWSLSKVQNLHHALDHGDGSRCRLSLLCNHADSVFCSHLSRLHLEDFGIDLFSSEMMQSLHSLIFYLICVKKQREEIFALGKHWGIGFKPAA